MKKPSLMTVLKWMLGLLLFPALLLTVWALTDRAVFDRGLNHQADRGSAVAARIFIALGARVNTPTPRHLLSPGPPLVRAAMAGHVDVVKVLLENRANVNARDYHGLTALAWAARRGHLEVAQVLLDNGAHVDSRSHSGATPLKDAVCMGHADVVRLLLERGSDVNASIRDGSTVLMWATISMRPDLIELLIDKRADVNAKARNGSTALTWAAAVNNQDAVRLLRARGAEAPLSLAATIGDKAKVKQLLDAGANTGPVSLVKGGAVAPKSLHETIRLESQRVTIRLRPLTYLVDAEFHFLNTGERTTEWVGFPKRVSYGSAVGDKESFVRFDTFVNGQKVDAVQERDLTNYGSPVKGAYQHNRWLAHRVMFPARARTVVRVIYESVYATRHLTREATYVYGTGSKWKGTIGQATFIIDSSDVGRAKKIDVDLPSTAGPRRISDYVQVLELRDFEPPVQAEIGVRIHGF